MPNEVIIRLVSFANGQTWHGYQWLMSYDAWAFDGRGDVLATNDRNKALRFASASEAFEFWRQVPGNRPVREDGKPNRPLTAFTIEVVRFREEENDQA